MLKIKNIRRILALIGTGVTIVSFSGCTKNNERKDESISKNNETSIINTEVSIDYDIDDIDNNEAYWWPIGSIETFKTNGKVFASGMPEDSTIVNAFSYEDKIKQTGHEAIDIITNNEDSKTNIIASKSGIVIYPTKDDRIDYKNNEKESIYGNYVVIKHPDNNYTLYAHLKENTILVRAGDKVYQGQIIGKLGNSGLTTGDNLHFEIRYGGNAINRRVNPEVYVTMKNPRLVKIQDNYEEIIYYSREQILSNAILSLNTCNKWELKLADRTLVIITDYNLIDYLNAKSEELGTIVFSMSDLESLGIKDSVLNNSYLNDKSKVMH